MSQNSHQKQRGYSLLELLLVLLVMTILIFLGIGQYKSYQRTQNLEALRTNITELLTATNAFYRQQCKPNSNANNFKAQFDSATFNITTINEKFPLNLIRTHLVKGDDKLDGGGYQLSAVLVDTGIQTINGITFYPYRLVLKVNLLAGVDANWYAGALNAKIDPDAPKTLVWEFLPSLAEQRAGKDLWIMDAGLAQFKRSAVTKRNEDDANQCTY